jgi:hypothetical protein
LLPTGGVGALAALLGHQQRLHMIASAKHPCRVGPQIEQGKFRFSPRWPRNAGARS